MPNFFDDNDDIQFLFNNMAMAELAAVQEDNFTRNTGKGNEYAPVDAADAIDNYRRILQIVGDVAGNYVAPRSEQVDHDGNVLNEDGTVTLGKGVQENIDVLAKADLLGCTLPREYGGLNCPNVVYTMAIEMISRADASLMNIFGLQGIAETIYAFANDEIRAEYLPQFAEGKVTGAMVLTEPDAGSDLQAVSLRAWQDEDGQWRLTGVKRFITNGCGNILLTLARSEPEVRDGRGLSLFLSERGPRIRVRHLEEKLGIHGSPTCELVYDDAPATLIGERQRGLITYVMALMNGARVGIAAQSLGIAEAAYRLARIYAHTRKQFGVSIERLPAVAELVTDMKIAVEAGRILAYDTSRVCDLENNNARVLEFNKNISPEEAKQRKADSRVFKRLNGMLTPMSKYYCSEMCMRVASDAIQVLGGSGYMKDYPAERYYRDARITTIYEGTSQLQIVAAVRGVCGGGFEKRVEELERISYSDPELAALRTQLDAGKALVLKGIAFVKAKGGEYTDLWGRKLVDAAAAVLIGHLLLDHARASEHKKAVARRFIRMGMITAQRDIDMVCSDDRSAIDDYQVIAGPVPAA